MEKPENQPIKANPDNAEETGARLNIFQKRDPFDDFMEHIDQEAERRAPTEIEIEAMDRNLIQLGQIFENTNNNWHIDGALNISILKGEYIGIHKDVDISLEAAELADTDQHIEEMGYGFFLSYPEDDSDRSKGHVMQRINFASGEQIEEGKHLMLAAIDEGGNILEGQSLNFVDVHVIERNAEGKPIGSTGVELPEEWFVGQERDFKGQEIKISHPAKVAYYKLHSERSYDKTDLEALAKTGTLSIEDVEEIAQIFEQEFSNRQNQFEAVIKDLLQKTKPGMSVEEVFNVLTQHPVIAEKIKYIESSIRAFAQAIADSEEMSPANIMEQALAIFKVQESFDSKRAEIDAIRKMIIDQVKLEKLRGNIEQ
ncbi:hypothetical protein C0580_04710 [Candidatus Parcubacteria bacterium]|nr:MAG: hypothetical protein C0580_04710 [Candidatus Parcubacteria bacterium]